MSETPIYREAVRAWCADVIDKLTAPLKAEVGMPNPLAYGHRCPNCGTFLDKPERACPMGCAA